jgi:HK97 gp10 family phage protein
MARVQGAARLRKLLRELPAGMTAEIRAAVQIGAEDILRTATALVPEKSGATSRALKIRYSRDRLAATIGTHDREAPLAHLIEFGTAAGQRTSSAGTPYQHPGTKPQPFLLPAYERHRQNAFRLMRAAVQNSLRKAAK